MGGQPQGSSSVEGCYLETQEVYLLTQAFSEGAGEDGVAWGVSRHAYPCMQWPLTVGSIDWTARELSSVVGHDELRGCRAPRPETRLLYHQHTRQPSGWSPLDICRNLYALGVSESVYRVRVKRGCEVESGLCVPERPTLSYDFSRFRRLGLPRPTDPPRKVRRGGNWPFWVGTPRPTDPLLPP